MAAVKEIIGIEVPTPAPQTEPYPTTNTNIQILSAWFNTNSYHHKHKMKFTLAASILLTQALPVLSKKSQPSYLLTAANDHDMESSRFHALAEKHKPASNNLETFNPFLMSIGGVRMHNTDIAHIQECNPSSDDPDTGILSCDDGYGCVVDDASTLGGFCDSSSSSRELQEYCRFCMGTYGAVLGASKHGVALTTPGYEGKTCGDLYNGFWNDCNAARQVAEDAGCCVTYGECDMCGDLTFVPKETVRLQVYDAYCAEFQLMLNETMCKPMSETVAMYCCESGTNAPTPAPFPENAPVAPVAAPDDAPVAAPDNEAPVAAPDGEAPVAAPDDARVAAPNNPPTATPASDAITAVWPTDTLISMISLTLVATATVGCCNPKPKLMFT